MSTEPKDLPEKIKRLLGGAAEKTKNFYLLKWSGRKGMPLATVDGRRIVSMQNDVISCEGTPYFQGYYHRTKDNGDYHEAYVFTNGVIESTDRFCVVESVIVKPKESE
jgi:hypothetical protein